MQTTYAWRLTVRSAPPKDSPHNDREAVVVAESLLMALETATLIEIDPAAIVRVEQLAKVDAMRIERDDGEVRTYGAKWG